MKTVKIIMICVTLLILAISGYYFYPENKLPKGTQIDSILVYKSKRQLLAYSNGKLIKTYKIVIGRNPVGAKEYEGDNKTPEGIYFINDKNANSGYHKNLGISYPEQKDIIRAKKMVNLREAL